jgi:DNA damage-regulated autophagy modulator protein 2
VVLCVYIRHRQLLSQAPPHRPPEKLLLAGLWTGWLASLGISIIANFQIEAVSIIHGAGAFLAFALGVPYLWIQVSLLLFDFYLTT